MGVAMKFSLVDNERREAEPKLSGICPFCKAKTIAKCGEILSWHWAHYRKHDCDHWWENEQEWHRNWKNKFPNDWQEVIHRSEDGEKHIADIKTDHSWAIEFQHSYLDPKERRSRELFYKRMVWVVDGLRRKNDLKQFTEAIQDHGILISERPRIHSVFPDFCRLIKEWLPSDVPVFFDFGEQLEANSLWLLIPMGSDKNPCVTPIDKNTFIDWHLKGNFTPQPIMNSVRELKREMEFKQSASGHFPVSSYRLNPRPHYEQQRLKRKPRRRF
tara:strand:- start:61 stop:876 length:816 start_codon:yes stop_codon:yes gene_type:complete